MEGDFCFGSLVTCQFGSIVTSFGCCKALSGIGKTLHPSSNWLFKHHDDKP